MIGHTRDSNKLSWVTASMWGQDKAMEQTRAIALQHWRFLSTSWLCLTQYIVCDRSNWVSLDMLWAILTWTPGCCVTCTVTLLSMTCYCATPSKPLSLQLCSFSNVAVCLSHIKHIQRFAKLQSPRNVSEHPSTVCLYYIWQLVT